MTFQQSTELARRGQAIYEQKLKRQLELNHLDDFVAIEPDSGDFFIGKSLSEAIAGGSRRASHAVAVRHSRRTLDSRRTWSNVRVNGEVDNAGRALVRLQVRPSSNTAVSELIAWVDTAFTGELVVPRAIIGTLSLQQSAAVMATLADGTQIVLQTYSCIVEWFGQERIVEVVENDGQLPLLGIGLLRDRKLEIDYSARTLSIE